MRLPSPTTPNPDQHPDQRPDQRPDPHRDQHHDLGHASTRVPSRGRTLAAHNMAHHQSHAHALARRCAGIPRASHRNRDRRAIMYGREERPQLAQAKTLPAHAPAAACILTTAPFGLVGAARLKPQFSLAPVRIGGLDGVAEGALDWRRGEGWLQKQPRADQRCENRQASFHWPQTRRKQPGS